MEIFKCSFCGEEITRNLIVDEIPIGHKSEVICSNCECKELRTKLAVLNKTHNRVLEHYGNLQKDKAELKAELDRVRGITKEQAIKAMRGDLKEYETISIDLIQDEASERILKLIRGEGK